MADANAPLVLVTGSTGAIGQPVLKRLMAEGYRVRGFARRPTPNIDDYVQGDLSDRDAVDRAMDGVDYCIHLGAYPNPADFLEVLLQPNVVGLYNICEAARETQVKRLVLSSSVQAVSGMGHEGRTITLADGTAPRNHYAVTKVWAEVMGSMYARAHEMSVVTVRIGWLPRTQAEVERIGSRGFGPRMYFSHDDAGRFYLACVRSESPAPGTHEIVFAASAHENPFMDLEPARSILGYEPQDHWPDGCTFE